MASMIAAVVLVASACSGSGSVRPGGAAGTAVDGTTAKAVATTTTTAPGPGSTADICPGSGTIARKDIAYMAVDGVEPGLLSLDVYEPKRPADCPAPPIMIYVHGGAWRTGDKSRVVDDKISWLNDMGWVFVSVNYRLSPMDIPADPRELDPERVTYPTHNNDVAAAIAWVRDNAERVGADPNSISLMGHSAGAAIIAAVATDESYLADHDLDLASIRCVVPLDTASFDIRERVGSDDSAPIFLNAFGSDPEAWDDASPVNHVGVGKAIPDFFLVTRGSSYRVGLVRDFADQLSSVGARAELLEVEGLDHEGINKAIGSPGDGVITPALGRFLPSCRSN